MIFKLCKYFPKFTFLTSVKWSYLENHLTLGKNRQHSISDMRQIWKKNRYCDGLDPCSFGTKWLNFTKLSIIRYVYDKVIQIKKKSVLLNSSSQNFRMVYFDLFFPYNQIVFLASFLYHVNIKLFIDVLLKNISFICSRNHCKRMQSIYCWNDTYMSTQNYPWVRLWLFFFFENPFFFINVLFLPNNYWFH